MIKGRKGRNWWREELGEGRRNGRTLEVTGREASR